jgi:hypothetical protein
MYGARACSQGPYQHRRVGYVGVKVERADAPIRSVRVGASGTARHLSITPMAGSALAAFVIRTDNQVPDGVVYINVDDIDGLAVALTETRQPDPMRS